MGSGAERRIVWAPQHGTQHAYVSCPAQEVFFGGARGGSKTDSVLGKWGILAMEHGHKFNAVMFRRTVTSAEDAIERSKEIYGPLGGHFTQNPSNWRMPGGGRIRFRYLDNVADADHYQGQNLTHIWVEEAGQYADSIAIDRLYGALRSPHGIPTQLTLTANPGGAGQSWLRDRYRLSPLPKRPIVFTRKTEGGNEIQVAVIPSRLKDNKILLKKDPSYESRLRAVGRKALVDAWLDGNWSSVEGAFFNDWSNDLVIEPFPIPENWIRFRSFDWGYAAPFSVGWWAFATEPGYGVKQGTLVRYREWYGASKPNVGLRLSAEKIRNGILEREEPGERIDYSVADPSIFAEDGGPSIAERMLPIVWQRGDNRRVGTRGHIGGWDQLRARMRDRMLLVFSTCHDSQRLLPLQQHDPKRVEDLDSEGEEHIADEHRYAAMSRIYSRRDPNVIRLEPKELPTALPPRPKTHNRISSINRRRA